MVNSHGGDLNWAKTQYAGEILDFSVNCNPLGTPPAAVAAARAALSDTGCYPDPACTELRAAIARMDGTDPDRVFCGSGAAEVIFRLALSLHPRTALLTAPAFSEYETALTRVGCACRFHPLREGEHFDVTDRILADLTEDVELLFLCTPNNPTGRCIEPDLLARILEKCEAVGAYLIVDECFLPLARSGPGMAPLLPEHPKLILLRAFTKSYAVPALRLGYCLADPALIARLETWGPCWNVSGPAQAAGLACCQLPQWPEQGRALLETARPSLQRGLTALGCQVVPGEANYLLFRLPGVTDLKARMLGRGILLRSCANYRGLGPDWYRTAVRTPGENQILLDTLAAVLAAGEA